jgi:DNA-binding CsgD family transcriptional regulator/PAS domain-containing protein
VPGRQRLVKPEDGSLHGALGRWHGQIVHYPREGRARYAPGAAMRTADRNPVMGVIGAAYEAALDSHPWVEVAAAISKLLGGERAAFGVIDTQNPAASFSVQPRGRADQGLFRERYLTPVTNPGLAFALASPVLAVEDRLQQFSDRDLLRTDFYHDVMRPDGLWHALQLNIYRDERYLAPLGVLRTRSQHPFEAVERDLLQRLAPHLNRSIRVMLRLREIEARADAAGVLVDRMGVAMVLTDSAGRVVSVNRLAQAILNEADGVLLQDGILRAVGRRDRIRLARLITEAAGGACGVMQVLRPSSRRPLPLVVSPSRPAYTVAGQNRAVSVTFADPERTPEADGDLLARLYGLTRRESDVAILLLQGRPPAAIATELAMTLNTVRTHIRHLFEKTGTDRLSELVRLLLRGPLAGCY